MKHSSVYQLQYREKNDGAKWRVKIRLNIKIEIFVKTVYRFQPVTIYAKSSVLDVWLSSTYASINNYLNNFLRWRHIQGEYIKQ